MYVKPVFVQKIWGELTGSQCIENEILIENMAMIKYVNMLASPK